ncbi:hypothetical protein PLESTM_001894000 [Pleodorina starrii]|nr:hypothetical protein PLESTM_001894000 [Pleodorina starrii]
MQNRLQFPKDSLRNSTVFQQSTFFFPLFCTTAHHHQPCPLPASVIPAATGPQKARKKDDAQKTACAPEHAIHIHEGRNPRPHPEGRNHEAGPNTPRLQDLTTTGGVCVGPHESRRAERTHVRYASTP